MANEPGSVEGLLYLDAALAVRKQLKDGDNKLVWTNGCFDILHIGHLKYLQKARSLGDALMVGLNSDASYQNWKKKPGPINSQADRAAVLLGLKCVDFVLIFDDPSPNNMLGKIRPDIFVKGDDYDINSLDPRERQTVEGYGGDIRFCSGVEGISTSLIVERILRLYN